MKTLQIQTIVGFFMVLLAFNCSAQETVSRTTPSTVFVANSNDSDDYSEGIYRLPYQNDTEMKVNRNHETHTPSKNRYDLKGENGNAPYQIVAAASGIIRIIQDDGTETCSTCDNNYVWIEHPNGEWTKYSHLDTNSVRGDANLSEGDHVSAGTFLGYESDIGKASGVHLHFEVAVPYDAENPLRNGNGFSPTSGGFINGKNKIARFCNITSLENGEIYRALPCSIDEYSRHALPTNKFQSLFNQLTEQGLELNWLDGYSVGGKPYLNVVFGKSSGKPWKAFFGLSPSAYQTKFNNAKQQGLQPVFVDSYTVNGSVKYNVIFKKVSGKYLSRHGLSYQQHMDVMEKAKSKNLRPVCVSVAPVNGKRKYTVLYRSEKIGSWIIKSRVEEKNYQALFDKQREAGRSPMYLNAYKLGGKVYLSAIFASNTPDKLIAKHGMSGSSYQNQWENATGNGYQTKVVTAFDNALNKHRFAAVWVK